MSHQALVRVLLFESQKITDNLTSDGQNNFLFHIYPCKVR